MDPDTTEIDAVAAINKAARRWGVMPLLCAIAVLIVLGIASILAGISPAQRQQATRRDVQRNYDLIEQVKVLQAANEDRSSDRYARLCAQINAIAAELQVPATVCAS